MEERSLARMAGCAQEIGQKPWLLEEAGDVVTATVYS